MNNIIKEYINIPNFLTLIRIIAIIPFLIFLFLSFWQAKLIAFLIFIFASITDLIDGWFARKLNQKTKFGNFLDPLADKLFVAAALISLPFIEKGIFPFWMVVLILGREVLITYLRAFAISKQKEIETMKMGKTKTTFQLFSIAIILLLLVIKAYKIEKGYNFLLSEKSNYSIIEIVLNYFYDLKIFIAYTPKILIFLTMLITVYSGIYYIYKNRSLFFKNKK